MDISGIYLSLLQSLGTPLIPWSREPLLPSYTHETTAYSTHYQVPLLHFDDHSTVGRRRILSNQSNRSTSLLAACKAPNMNILYHILESSERDSTNSILRNPRAEEGIRVHQVKLARLRLLQNIRFSHSSMCPFASLPLLRLPVLIQLVSALLVSVHVSLCVCS